MQRLQSVNGALCGKGIWKLTSVAKLGGVAACACNGKARTGEEVLDGVHVWIGHCYWSMEMSRKKDPNRR